MTYMNVVSLMGELHMNIIAFEAILVICLGFLSFLLFYSQDRNKIKRHYNELKDRFKPQNDDLISDNFCAESDEEAEKKSNNRERNLLYSSIYRELTRLMSEEKIYHDPKLTRDEVVVRLGTSRKVFLEALQNHVDMSFIDYVNTFRLNEAISLLENEDYTNETIAETVGFGSANTFYRQFRTKYGLSPFEYKKNLNMILINEKHCEVEI